MESLLPKVYAHISAERKQLLANHLTNVAELSRSHAQKIGLPLHGELIGILHDFGKYSTEFQNYLKSATGFLNPDEDEDFVDAKALCVNIDVASNKEVNYGIFKSSDGRRVKKSLAA